MHCDSKGILLFFRRTRLMRLFKLWLIFSSNNFLAIYIPLFLSQVRIRIYAVAVFTRIFTLNLRSRFSWKHCTLETAPFEKRLFFYRAWGVPPWTNFVYSDELCRIYFVIEPTKLSLIRFRTPHVHEMEFRKIICHVKYSAHSLRSDFLFGCTASYAHRVCISCHQRCAVPRYFATSQFSVNVGEMWENDSIFESVSFHLCSNYSFKESADKFHYGNTIMMSNSIVNVRKSISLRKVRSNEDMKVRCVLFSVFFKVIMLFIRYECAVLSI